jgi:HD superfamily phosphohydrolase YqeK
MVSIEERSKVFEKELELIFDESIREFTRLCLFEAPDYFFVDCPASSSGKYHPISELGPDGTMLHTKKVFTLAYTLCRGLGCEQNRDQILAATIIHDLRKQGLTRTGHTTRNHPGLAADLVDEVQEATQLLTKESHTMIKNSVGYHYGPWSHHPWQKPLSEYTAEELCVYVSDYVASKREVEVNYKR